MICSKCGIDKPRTEFYTNYKGKQCKLCKCDYAKLNVKKNRDKKKSKYKRRVIKEYEWTPNKVDLREQAECRRSMGMGW